VVGGLFLSQTLTVYVKPAFYLYMEQFQQWLNRHTSSPGEVAG
jgi:hypothetical protein